ncbi:MAG: FeoA family protein [Actinomycetes bacterium]
MSLVSTALGGRVVTGCAGICPDTAPTLADFVPGDVVTIADVCDAADAAASRRLFDLGFVPGAQVEVLRKAPLGDPVVYRVLGYEIALRRAQARCIRVGTGR